MIAYAPFLAAAALAAIAFSLTKILAEPKDRLGRMVEDYRSTEEAREPLQGSLGDALLRHLPINLHTWQEHLEWAQRGGHYFLDAAKTRKQTLGAVVFNGLLFGGAGLLLWLMRPAPIMLLAPLVAGAIPFIRLRKQANKVRKKTVRALPEAAAMIAAELSAGSSVDQALRRATELGGPLADWIDQVMQFGKDTGRPVISRSSEVRGALVEVFGRSGLSELRAFAMQLDEVGKKGGDGPEMMNTVARGLSRDYRETVMRQKELLSGKLTKIVALHFLFPTIVLILAAFFIPLIAVLT